jgi:hypothetical protein
MNETRRQARLAALVTTAALAAACYKQPASETAPPRPADEIYSIALVVNTTSALPRCTATLAGTTTYVQSPASLYTCVSGTWWQIPCSTILAGAVAYASTGHTLLACVQGQWTPVALPSGPVGPDGPPGPTGASGPAGAAGSQLQLTAEPPGPNCPTGGERIDVGVPGDGGFAVAQTAYVCNGVTSAPTDGGTTADASPDGGTAADASPDGGAVSEQWVMGYYPWYQMSQLPIESIDWSSLTHVIFGPVALNDGGTLDLSFGLTVGAGMDTARALANAAHAHGVKALLLVGGLGDGWRFQEFGTALSPEIAFAVGNLGYDGVELDWEDQIDLSVELALVGSLRTFLPDQVITSVYSALNRNFDTVDPRLATIAAHLDRIDVQMFPPTVVGGGSSWFVNPLGGATPSTPYAIDDSLARYAAAGIPRSKLTMGVALYAACYSSPVTGPRQGLILGVTDVSGLDDFPLSALFAPGGLLQSSSPIWDDQAAEPYLAFPDVGKIVPGCRTSVTGSIGYIPFEDEKSIAANGVFSKRNGYGGINVWTLADGWLLPGSAGGRQPDAIMKALKAAFLDP